MKDHDGVTNADLTKTFRPMAECKRAIDEALAPIRAGTRALAEAHRGARCEFLEQQRAFQREMALATSVPKALPSAAAIVGESAEGSGHVDRLDALGRVRVLDEVRDRFDEGQRISTLASQALIAGEIADGIQAEIAEVEQELADDEQVTLKWYHFAVAVHMRVEEIFARDPGIIVFAGQRAEVVDGDLEWKPARQMVHVTGLSLTIVVEQEEPQNVVRLRIVENEEV